MPDAPDFEEFYQANYGRLVALVAAMTGDRAEAEDVAQETFSRALSRGHRLGDYDLPEAWLRKVALRIAVDSSRRVRRTVLIAARVAAQRPRPAPLPEDGLGFTDLGRALRRLPASHRQVAGAPGWRSRSSPRAPAGRSASSCPRSATRRRTAGRCGPMPPPGTCWRPAAGGPRRVSTTDS